jgi:hypothetical protein
MLVQDVMIVSCDIIPFFIIFIYTINIINCYQILDQFVNCRKYVFLSITLDFSNLC